jgi:hypothetical protein
MLLCEMDGVDEAIAKLRLTSPKEPPAMSELHNQEETEKQRSQ